MNITLNKLYNNKMESLQIKSRSFILTQYFQMVQLKMMKSFNRKQINWIIYSHKKMCNISQMFVSI